MVAFREGGTEHTFPMHRPPMPADLLQHWKFAHEAALDLFPMPVVELLISGRSESSLWLWVRLCLGQPNLWTSISEMGRWALIGRVCLALSSPGPVSDSIDKLKVSKLLLEILAQVLLDSVHVYKMELLVGGRGGSETARSKQVWLSPIRHILRLIKCNG